MGGHAGGRPPARRRPRARVAKASARAAPGATTVTASGPLCGGRAGGRVDQVVEPAAGAEAAPVAPGGGDAAALQHERREGPARHAAGRRPRRARARPRACAPTRATSPPRSTSPPGMPGQASRIASSARSGGPALGDAAEVDRRAGLHPHAVIGHVHRARPGARRRPARPGAARGARTSGRSRPPRGPGGPWGRSPAGGLPRGERRPRPRPRCAGRRPTQRARAAVDPREVAVVAEAREQSLAVGDHATARRRAPRAARRVSRGPAVSATEQSQPIARKRSVMSRPLTTCGW